jgi:hypothetical protein
MNNEIKNETFKKNLESLMATKGEFPGLLPIQQETQQKLNELNSINTNTEAPIDNDLSINETESK